MEKVLAFFSPSFFSPGLLFLAFLGGGSYL